MNVKIKLYNDNRLTVTEPAKVDWETERWTKGDKYTWSAFLENQTVVICCEPNGFRYYADVRFNGKYFQIKGNLRVHELPEMYLECRSDYTDNATQKAQAWVAPVILNWLLVVYPSYKDYPELCLAQSEYNEAIDRLDSALSQLEKATRKAHNTRATYALRNESHYRETTRTRFPVHTDTP